MMAWPSWSAPLTDVLVRAQQDGGGQGEDFGKSSPVGLLLLVLFLIAVAFLVRSMTKHLRRVPASFDTEEHETDETSGERGDSASSGEDVHGSGESDSPGDSTGQAKAGGFGG